MFHERKSVVILNGVVQIIKQNWYTTKPEIVKNDNRSFFEMTSPF